MAKAKTLEKRIKFLDSIELTKDIEGLAETKCTKCLNASFQAHCKRYEEEDFVVPAERLSVRQRNSHYWLLCVATGKTHQLAEISECEMFEPLPSARNIGGLEKSNSLFNI